MTQYFYQLRDGTAPIRDAEAIEMPDDAAAIAYGRTVAGELMNNCEPQTRHWLLGITGENGESVSELRFATIDHTLNHLSARSRALVEQHCETYLALLETIARSRQLVRRSRALLNRSRGRPYLCTDGWGELVG
jgi:Domain of unknown function (DUF6894)